MPIFDIHCNGCEYDGEVLVLSASEPLVCPACGSGDAVKRMAVTSTLTGGARRSMPGANDHGCCGSRPSQAGCAGPGSCCGRLGQ